MLRMRTIVTVTVEYLQSLCLRSWLSGGEAEEIDAGTTKIP